MAWTTLASAFRVGHYNHPPHDWHASYRPGATSMHVTPADDALPSQVTLHHVTSDGLRHAHTVSLYPDSMHVYADGHNHTIPGTHPVLKDLIDNHHAHHDSWPAILDSILEHPALEPHFTSAVEHHVAHRYSGG